MFRLLTRLRGFREQRLLLIVGLGVVSATLASLGLVDSRAPWVGLALAAALGIGLAGGFAYRHFRLQELRMRTAVNNMTQGLIMFDSTERIVACNDRYIQMYGVSPEIVRPGCRFIDLLRHRVATGTLSRDPETYRDSLLAELRAKKLTTWIVENTDGRAIAVTQRLTADGGWVATHDDITQRVRSQKALERTRAFLDAVIENVPATIVVRDIRDHRYVLVNRAGEAFLGIPRKDVIGKTPNDVFPDGAAAIMVHDEEVLRSGGRINVDEHLVRTPGNGSRLAVTKKLAIADAAGKPGYLLSVIEDVTDKRLAEERIAHMAHHDSLTDLPNRAAFNTELDAIIERARASEAGFAVLFIDLDRFKEINDVFGPAAGDELLRQICDRFRTASSGNFLARLGGDEFAVVSTDGPQPATAEALAERLLASVADEFVVADQQLRISLTIGVAVFPGDGTDPATLLANADAALDRAKSEGRGMIRFFEADMDKRLRERRALQHELSLALSRNELTLHYQPQATIRGGIVGFEALLRWNHGSRGMISPGTFIPIAEDSGLIVPIGEWVLREACREAASWSRPLRIAANLSPVQFRHGDLVGMIHSILLNTGLAPGRLELEVTEGVLIGDFSRAVAILRRLKSLGVRIAMDDFGTGYSSLSYLQSFPFDAIKIDKAFISNLEQSVQSAAIVRAVIGLARGLNVPVIAEGVETSHQLEFLSQVDCDEVQGYLIGKPRPIEQYLDLIEQRSPQEEPARSAG